MTVGLVLHFVHNMEIKPRPAGQADLHQKLYILMALIRLAGIVLSIVFNWIKRQEFIDNLNDLQNFREHFLKKYKMLKKYEKFFETEILKKLFWSSVCETLMASGTMQVLYDNFGVRNPWILTVLGLISTVLNLVICHYYFISLNVEILFSIIIDELKIILNSVGDIIRMQYAKYIGPGALMTLCCQYSDKLDDLAQAHRELQIIGDRINKMYYVQGVCVMLVLYMNNVCVLYMGYLMAHHEKIWPQLGETISYVMPLALLFYYIDSYLLIYLILRSTDKIAAPQELLKERQPWLPTLDRRLERSVS